jgi:hypothetical protein
MNSPCHAASCDLAIEHSQGELKPWLRKWKRYAESERDFDLQVENAAHALTYGPGTASSEGADCFRQALNTFRAQGLSLANGFRSNRKWFDAYLRGR